MSVMVGFPCLLLVSAFFSFISEMDIDPSVVEAAAVERLLWDWCL